MRKIPEGARFAVAIQLVPHHLEQDGNPLAQIAVVRKIPEGARFAVAIQLVPHHLEQDGNPLAQIPVAQRS